MESKEIELLSNAIEKIETDCEEVDPSFFNVIRRDHDENLISKMLSYIFAKHSMIIENLVRNHCNPAFELDGNLYCKNEDYTGDGRIDILIKDNKNQIAIENKIWSSEHDDQCKRYYNYYHSKHPENDYYFYLTPGFNKPYELSDSHFKIITYNDLLQTMEALETKDVYVQDFIRLIKNSLSEVAMNDLDIIVAKNFKKVRESYLKVQREYTRFLKDVGRDFVSSCGVRLVEDSDNDREYSRFYLPDVWRKDDSNPKEKYYFYIEFHFVGWDQKQIDCQQTLLIYDRDSNSQINRFMADKGIDRNCNYYYVYNIKTIVPNEDLQPLSNEWKNDVRENIIETMKQSLSQQQELVNEFLEWKEKEDVVGNNGEDER